MRACCIYVGNKDLLVGHWLAVHCESRPLQHAHAYTAAANPRHTPRLMLAVLWLMLRFIRDNELWGRLVMVYSVC